METNFSNDFKNSAKISVERKTSSFDSIILSASKYPYKYIAFVDRDIANRTIVTIEERKYSNRAIIDRLLELDIIFHMAGEK